MRLFDEKVVLVTGSTAGIGAGIASAFGRHGARVVVNSRKSDAAGEELANSLPEAMYVRGDVSVEADARRLVESALARWGRIDVVVNSAGSRAKIRHDDLDALDDPTWQAMIQANLLGPWYVTRAAVPALRASGDGVVINISSLSGVRSTSWNGNTIAYGVTKAGLNHLTTLLAASLGPEIRVNALIPGMIVEADASLGPVGSVVARATPLGRPGSPADLGDACIFLALSRYITGESIMIDGGLSLRTFGERTSLEPDARRADPVGAQGTGPEFDNEEDAVRAGLDVTTFKHLAVSRDGDDVVTIVVRQRNHGTHTELSRIFSELRFDHSRVVILTGENDFFLGLPNLPEFAAVDEHVWQRLMREGRALVRDSLEIPQILVVALNGDAVGLGASILSVADFVVAASGTVVRESHLRMGIAAGDGGTLTMPVLLGLHRAKRMFLLDESFSVEDLCELGVVYEVVERDALLDAARRLASRLLELPRPALEWTKASLNRVLHQAVLIGLDSAIAHEGWSWHLEASQSQIAELRRSLSQGGNAGESNPLTSL